MTAEVIPLRHPRGHSQTSELQLELDSRSLEERRFARDAEPILRQLEFAVSELGPQWLAKVHHLMYLHSRHRARWSPQPDPEAA